MINAECSITFKKLAGRISSIHAKNEICGNEEIHFLLLGGGYLSTTIED